MMNASRRISIYGAIVSIVFIASSALAQDTTPAPVTAFGKQMERVDFGVTGIGIFSPKTSGTSLTPEAVAQVPSNTFGALIELRYIKSRFIGAEFNYTYGRYDQNYTVTPTASTPPGQSPYLLTVQSKVDEISMGYVAHGPDLFGIHTFASAGVGAIEFKPTTGGGQNVQKEVRTGVY